MEISFFNEGDKSLLKPKVIRRYNGCVQILLECKGCKNLVSITINKNIAPKGVKVT